MLVSLEGLDEGLVSGMLDEFKTGWNRQKVVARAAQKRLGQTNQTERKSVDGLGAMKAQISADSFHYWGQRLGYDCWKDKQFMDNYLSENPQCRVKSKGTKLQVGHGSTPKYRKSYG